MKTSTFNFPVTIIVMVLFLSIFFKLQTFGQSFPTEVSREGLVFDGKISSSKGVWSSDKSTIYTLNWVKPSSLYAGNLEEGDSIPVLTKGGITEEGILVVSHSRRLYTGYSYLMAVEPCLDCVKGMKTWRIKGSLGEFNQEEYHLEKNRWANKPRMKEQNSKTLCPQNGETLYLTFSHVHLIPGLNNIAGYIDVKARTAQESKLLYSLSSTINYDNSIFGSFAITNQSMSIAPFGTAMQQAYTSLASDAASNKASFSMTKNAAALTSYSVETSFTPTARISFTIPTSSLNNLPSALENLLTLEGISAEYLCNGKAYPFRQIVIVDGTIGVEIEGKTAAIVYSFEDVAFNTSNDEYSFTVYAKSSEDAHLSAANIKLDFAANAFLPFQVDNGHIILSPVQNSVLSSVNYEMSLTQDIDASSVELNLTAINTDDLSNLELLLADVQRPLFRVTLKTSDCTVNPVLNFIPGQMQGQSTYFQFTTFPLPLVYNPVLATDTETTPGCGCAGNPIIESISPNPIVAGDGQILTITGSNFGVYERGNPNFNSGSGSTVCFTNGDADNGTNPPFIAASEKDFLIDGTIHWTDTEIKVKVPSTGYKLGVSGPASSGPIFVRNNCNNGSFSDDDLEIPYSLMTFRIGDDKAAKKLGLRNENGLNGEQDGYAFAFGPSTEGPDVNIDIKSAFSDALNTWCGATNIRFKKQEAASPTDIATANDGVNSITVEDLEDVDAQAGMVLAYAYFPISCGGVDPNDEDGGFIMSDIDFKVAPSFAVDNDQARAIEVFVHELGHAHLLNHARCVGFGCTAPAMEAYGGDTGIQNADIDGANRIFGTSADIIFNNLCLVGANIVEVNPIEDGGCGATNATKASEFLGIQLSPNPTDKTVVVSNLQRAGKYALFNSSGQILQFGDTQVGELHLDLAPYPQGSYFLTILHDTTTGHFKIVKL